MDIFKLRILKKVEVGAIPMNQLDGEERILAEKLLEECLLYSFWPSAETLEEWIGLTLTGLIYLST